MVQIGHMTSDLDTRAASVGDRRRTRAYLTEFVPGIAAYVLLLSAALLWGGFDGTDPTRFLWALLPVLPMIWIAVAVLRHLHRLDEYQRTRTLAGLGAGFAVAMLASIALGILQSAGFELEGSGFWIYALGMVTWGISAAVTSRR